MSFRFRLGPFTFGRTGTRLSIWGRSGGFSTPLSGQGRSFGKVSAGPFRWFFRGSKPSRPPELGRGTNRRLPVDEPSSHEGDAIDAFRSDAKFLERIRRRGVPWRGVQERIKQELPDSLPNRDQIAYELVPRAMNAAFGAQSSHWDTVKRPSRSGSGKTTWIISVE